MEKKKVPVRITKSYLYKRVNAGLFSLHCDDAEGKQTDRKGFAFIWSAIVDRSVSSRFDDYYMVNVYEYVPPNF